MSTTWLDSLEDLSALKVWFKISDVYIFPITVREGLLILI